MRPMEITVGIHPNDLAPWKGAEVPVRFVITETTILVQFAPPPPILSFMEELRQKFVKIETFLSGQSLQIMRFLLETQSGQATRAEFIDNIWPNNVPTFGRVRNAICVLNDRLKELKCGYFVKGSRRGLIKIERR